MSGLGVAGARVSASVTRVTSNGGHQTLEPAITLSDDGAAGEMTYGLCPAKNMHRETVCDKNTLESLTTTNNTLQILT